MPSSVSRVLNDSLDFVWAQVEPMVKRGLSRGAGAATSDQLRESIRSGDMVMWAVHEGPQIIAVLVLSVRQYAAKSTVFVELVAGREMESWLDRIEGLLRDYRKAVGADTIEATCRDGMAKRLTGRWKRKATLMELK